MNWLGDSFFLQKPSPVNEPFLGCPHIIRTVLIGELVTSSVSFLHRLELGSLRMLGPSLTGSP